MNIHVYVTRYESLFCTSPDITGQQLKSPMTTGFRYQNPDKLKARLTKSCLLTMQNHDYKFPDTTYIARLQ